MQEVLALAAPFFGLIALGFGAGKILRYPPEGLAWLNGFIIYFALPALFFQLVARTPFEELSRWSFVATTTLSTFAIFVLAAATGYLFERDLRMAAIQGAAGAYANVGYMGPGITLAALGPAATVPTALIFSFDSALIFALVPMIMAAGGARSGRVSVIGQIFRRIFLHPFIIATLAGAAAAYFQVSPPTVIATILEYLSRAAAPCALFALGVTVALRPLRRVPREMPFLALYKLVVHPLLVLGLLSLVGGFDPVWVATAVLMAALPPALNVFVLAQQYGVYVERASSAILLGTLASVVTLTTALYLVATGRLPLPG